MSSYKEKNKPIVLAIASPGGHWEQLMQIKESFDDAKRVCIATTDSRLALSYNIKDYCEIADYSQSEPVKVLFGLFETFRLVRKIKPNIIISTGAAPGLLCLFWGRIFGVTTIWIDSVANAETLSLSGKIAKRFATITLTQWENLAEGNVEYWGSVL